MMNAVKILKPLVFGVFYGLIINMTDESDLLSIIRSFERWLMI